MSNPVEEVLSTNAAFYEALATGDFGLCKRCGPTPTMSHASIQVGALFLGGNLL